MTVTYDPRLRSPPPAAMATVDDRRLRTTSTITTDPRTTLATCTVTLAETVTVGGVWGRHEWGNEKRWYYTRWSTTVKLKPGDRLDPRRRNSMSRTDAAWQ
ncbi:hypothetical protein [Streptomyces sp. NPDC050548]|uniref:hypothetical protein n=1 Tax=Streptomyces sp. NPDC050548 TaxID=3365629 RepID=UPI0037AF8236